MKFGIKRSVASLAVAGGAAALLFGGGAVSTAFSSDAGGSIAASGATVSLASSATDNMAISNLVPGGSVSAAPFTVNNNSTTPADLWLTAVGFNSTAGSPNAADVTVNIQDTNTNTGSGGVSLYNGSLTGLVGANTELGNPFPPNLQQNIVVTFTLSQNAGNSWNGAAATVPFTLHLQDASGTDNNTFVTTSNG
jgi:hypothetical protein